LVSWVPAAAACLGQVLTALVVAFGPRSDGAVRVGKLSAVEKEELVGSVWTRAGIRWRAAWAAAAVRVGHGRRVEDGP
jgi:hypothetical protein